MISIQSYKKSSYCVCYFTPEFAIICKLGNIRFVMDKRKNISVLHRYMKNSLRKLNKKHLL